MFKTKVNTVFYTFSFHDACIDIDKTVPIPRIGEYVFCDNNHGKVTDVVYHIFNGKLHTVNVIISPEEKWQGTKQT